MGRKQEHELFVQNLTGCSSLTVFSVLACIALFVFLDELLRLSWKKNLVSKKWTNFLLDFFVLVLPVLSTVTILSGWLTSLLIFLAITSLFASAVRIALSSGMTRQKDDLQVGEQAQAGRQSLEFMVVSQFRGCVLLLACVTILAVDFPVFPRQMGKTERQGYSVMDLGVGAFVIANALAAPQTKEMERSSWKMVVKEVQDTLVLLILGFSRFVSVLLTDYPVPEAEYGKHWNFFCTLAFVKILGRLAAVLVPPGAVAALGVCLAIVYECCLRLGLYSFVLDAADKAVPASSSSIVQFLIDNRSGLSSCLGFLAMFLMWLYVGRLFRNQRQSTAAILRLFQDLALYSLVLYGATLMLPLPSRRVVNMSYMFWVSYQAMAFLAFTLLTRLLLVSIDQSSAVLLQSFDPRNVKSSLWNIYQAFQEGKFEVDLTSHRASLFTPTILSAMNYNSMAIFLLANVLTGLINLSIDTTKCGDLVSMLILTAYLTVITSAAYFLYRRNIRLPLRLASLRPFCLPKTKVK
ncbi:hypothetical protein RvY_18277 [Ramazzottius varieornatus]|uniref:Phosphatidylinositol-glycan biosynthesis class W protein n=1 Tax=Ramazzottius varieornatus TaxID=947166 RepID=A0A1D1W567_RAMVA|nr:hypothetical protein RvY_18277 [Ramazzottius varieornatus]